MTWVDLEEPMEGFVTTYDECPAECSGPGTKVVQYEINVGKTRIEISYCTYCGALEYKEYYYDPATDDEKEFRKTYAPEAEGLNDALDDLDHATEIIRSLITRAR